jgi:hypothetical protein
MFVRSEYLEYVGKRYTDSMQGTFLSLGSGSIAVVRVIQPGSAHTMDYRVDRLNVHLGENDIIEQFTIG